jgi:malate permease and related proteins
MEVLLGHVGGVIAPVLLCVLVGYGLALINVPFENKVIGGLVANVGYPALILSHLAGQHVEVGAFLQMIGAAAASVVAFGVIGAAFLAITGLPYRAFLSPLMLSNVGNIGLPVASLAFGAAGLAYAIAFVVVVLVGIFTIGMWLPMGRVSLGNIVRQPVIYAVVIALAMMATQTQPPAPVGKALDILGGLAIPLMLLTLGHTLATLKVGHLKLGTLLALFHVVMAAGVAYGLVHLFGFTGTARGVFIVMCLMPVSVAVYLWVDMYNPERAPEVAGFILVSTLLTIVVLPLALAFWV